MAGVVVVLAALASCTTAGSRPAHALRPVAPALPTTLPPTTAPLRPLGRPPWTMGPIDGPLLAHRLSDVPGANLTPTDRVVALTFDDGPDPRFTPQVLALLARYGAPATFFMVGRQAARDPDLVRQVAAGGHSVEGHTWNHVDLTRLPDAAWASEVDRSDGLLSGLSGRPVRCVRAPKGRVDDRVVRLLGQRHLVTMMWSLDPKDWTMPGTSAISGYVLAGLRPGSVVLLHDGGGDRSETVAALPTILDALEKEGYQVVPLCR